MILGLIDIEANYLVIKAYQYTTLTSVQVSLFTSITSEPIGVCVCAQWVHGYKRVCRCLCVYYIILPVPRHPPDWSAIRR